MMSPFFYFQATLNRLFNNCVKLHWYQISSYCNMKGRGVKVLPNWPPLPLSSTKTTLKKPSLGLGFYYCRLPNPKITAQSIAFRFAYDRLKWCKMLVSSTYFGCISTFSLISSVKTKCGRSANTSVCHLKLQSFLVHCCNLMNKHGIWLFPVCLQVFSLIHKLIGYHEGSQVFTSHCDRIPNFFYVSFNLVHYEFN